MEHTVQNEASLSGIGEPKRGEGGESASTFALQALLDEAVEQRAAVVAEGEPLVGVHHEAVRHVHVEALAAAHAAAAALLLHSALVRTRAKASRSSTCTRRATQLSYLLLHARALRHHRRVAALVDDARAHCRQIRAHQFACGPPRSRSRRPLARTRTVLWCHGCDRNVLSDR